MYVYTSGMKVHWTKTKTKFPSISWGLVLTPSLDQILTKDKKKTTKLLYFLDHPGTDKFLGKGQKLYFLGYPLPKQRISADLTTDR